MVCLLSVAVLSQTADGVIFTEEEVAEHVRILREEGRFARRFLIINADDFGMSTDINAAIIETFQYGIITSATLMMPAPGMHEAVEFLRENPRAAVGLHLTLTSEWENYEWGPVLPPEEIPSLLEPNTKHFWPEIWPLLLHANTEEVEKEIEAQVALAHEMGVSFTHFDSHMGWSNFDFIVGSRMFNAIFPIVERERVPIRETLPLRRWRLREKGIWTQDRINFTISLTPLLGRQRARFIHALRNLPRGITEINFHPARDSKELRKIFSDWQFRVNERELLLCKEIKQIIEDEGIVLISFEPLKILSRESGE
ncbi:MAG: Carbohydrate deacetylase [Syntrophomonadaceae bacterium]|nr:Carbohydrate deacetylase [Bacillota bacterium]MBT9146399.1 Carbohydrate deacetylase [Bacillota bacterium]